MTDGAIIIQARMGSKRLPGKVMKEVGGRPLLGIMIDRLRDHERLPPIIVATTTRIEDREIYEFCESSNMVDCFMGSHNDVARRYIDCMKRYKLDWCVRLCGDSPWIDPDLVQYVIDIFSQGNWSMVTNRNANLPRGQWVEVFSKTAIRKSYAQMKTQYEYEHVTPFMYHNPSYFDLYFVDAYPPIYSNLNMSIDTPKDLATFKQVHSKMTKPYVEYTWKEIARMYASNKVPLRHTPNR